MKLRGLILLFLLVFGLTPLVLAVAINLPLVLDRVALFYQKAYLQNLRADFRDPRDDPPSGQAAGAGPHSGRAR